jgi:hypothetical protein
MSETARLRSVETAFVSGVAGPVAIQGVIIDASRFTGSTTLSGSSLREVLIGDRDEIGCSVSGGMTNSAVGPAPMLSTGVLPPTRAMVDQVPTGSPTANS